MGISERKVRQREAMKDMILTAAQEIVAAEGWQALSIRKIAEAIEYSAPVIYTHFENKDAIREIFVREGFTLLGNAVEAVLAGAGTAEEKLWNVAAAYRHFAITQSSYYRIMFDFGIPSCEAASMYSEIHRFGSLIRLAISQAMGPTVAEDKIWLKFHTFWSILHGLIAINLLKITETPGELRDPVFDDAVQGFIHHLNTKV
ncbi:TetR/AcrR family transcriptional regulator [Pedobacter yulinensis]|uniref:TetR/AcrR family transcriptional regulator n=1 Tax=Pedobacter yulinensis TaxID=2126353 RepID=A0A2T3HNY4_9SPHI|nr:TetR/AcrR family transcriptional regulator [Pedobacter yulinensis]PST84168.1 TetR/AcrR family transcriptional regulator [Pedobacter yulinensis]